MSHIVKIHAFCKFSCFRLVLKDLIINVLNRYKSITVQAFQLGCRETLLKLYREKLRLSIQVLTLVQCRTVIEFRNPTILLQRFRLHCGIRNKL